MRRPLCVVVLASLLAVVGCERRLVWTPPEVVEDGNEVLLSADFGGNTVTVLDADDLSPVATVTVYGNPHGVAAAGSTAIVANALIQNPATGNQTGIVDVIDLSASPPTVVHSVSIQLTSHSTETNFLYDAAITPGGSCGFVLRTQQSGEQSSGAHNGVYGRYDAWSSVHGIDLTKNPPEDAGSTVNVGQGTIRIAMHPLGAMLLAASVEEGQLQQITWNSDCKPSVQGSFPSSPLQSYPNSIVFPSTNFLVVGLYGTDGLSATSAQNLIFFNQIPNGWQESGSNGFTFNYPTALAPVSPTSFLIAMNAMPRDPSGVVQMVSKGYLVGNQISIGVPTALAVSSDGTQAYVADASTDQVFPLSISGDNLTVGTPAPVGPYPVALAIGNTGSGDDARSAARGSKPSRATRARLSGGSGVASSPGGTGPQMPLGVYPYTFGGTCSDAGSDPFAGGREDPITVVWWGPGVLQFAETPPEWPNYPKGWLPPAAKGVESAEDYINSLGPPGITQPLFNAFFYSTELGPAQTGGPGHIVNAAGNCIDMAGELAYPTGSGGYPAVPFNRYHVRLWPALVDAAGNPTPDSSGNYYFVGAPHKETWWSFLSVSTCTGTAGGNHAVDAGIPPGTGGYPAARECVANIFQQAGYALANQFWDNTMIFKQCTREWTGSDGGVVWIYIPTPSTDSTLNSPSPPPGTERTSRSETPPPPCPP